MTCKLENIGDIARQGDLYIELIAELPQGAAPCTTKDAAILAYGESGTHHHEVVGAVEVLERPSAEALVTDEDAVDLRERFLRVERDAVLKIAHDERRHDPIQLKDGGLYRTWIQRAYTPQGIERVAD